MMSLMDGAYCKHMNTLMKVCSITLCLMAKGSILIKMANFTRDSGSTEKSKGEARWFLATEMFMKVPIVKD